MKPTRIRPGSTGLESTRRGSDRSRIVSSRGLRAAVGAMLFALVAACTGSPPEPLLVLENPANGQRVSFYREIPFKVPADYDEHEHMASWRAQQEKAGFTRQIKP